jgi:ribose transport system permease protein
MDKKAKLSFANLYSTYGVFFILVIEFVIFSLASKSFLTLGNILSVGRQMSFTGIAAIGMTLVMLTGGIDISVGSMLAMAGVLCAKLSADVGLPLWIAVVITLLIGALFGLINGAAVTRLHIPALIATLATQTILKGIAYLLTNAVPVKNLSATYKFLGQGYIFGVIPVPLIITVALYVLAWWYLDKTYLGRRVYLSGGNEEAARLSGINTKWTITGTYVFSGVFAAIAGVLMAARLGSGQPSVGSGFEMDVITATVLGGISVNGGKGKVVNVFVGACIMGVLANGMTMLNINQYLQWIINGLVLLFAVTMSNLRKSSS